MQRVLVTLMLSWMLAGVAVASEPTSSALQNPVVPNQSDLIASPSAELRAAFDLPAKPVVVRSTRRSRKAQQLLDTLPNGAPEGLGEPALEELNP